MIKAMIKMIKTMMITMIINQFNFDNKDFINVNQPNQ